MSDEKWVDLFGIAPDFTGPSSVPAGAGGVDEDAAERFIRHMEAVGSVGAKAAMVEIRSLRAALAAAEQRAADAEGKIAALREHTLESNPALRQLHDAAVAYVDAREALAEVRGGPLSTTLGYLIRAGYLVPASPSVTEVHENFRLIARVKAAEQRAEALSTVVANVSALADEWRKDGEVSEWNPLAELDAALSSRPVMDGNHISIPVQPDTERSET